MGSRQVQNTYIFGCLTVKPKARTYRKKLKYQESRRTTTVEYKIKKKGKLVKLCKKEFLSIHGLQNSKARVDRLVLQVKEGLFTPTVDKRGKYDRRPNAYSPEALQFVRDHINAIPKYQSHYSRSQNLCFIFQIIFCCLYYTLYLIHKKTELLDEN